jgi:hypothetical protein
MPDTLPAYRLSLSASASIAACEQAHADLTAALAEADDVRLEIDPDAEVDLTLLQTLIAAKATAAELGKRIALQTPPAGGFARALVSCGFRPRPGATALADVFSLETRDQP